MGMHLREVFDPARFRGTSRRCPSDLLAGSGRVRSNASLWIPTLSILLHILLTKLDILLMLLVRYREQMGVGSILLRNVVQIVRFLRV